MARINRFNGSVATVACGLALAVVVGEVLAVVLLVVLACLAALAVLAMVVAVLVVMGALTLATVVAVWSCWKWVEEQHEVGRRVVVAPVVEALPAVVPMAEVAVEQAVAAVWVPMDVTVRDDECDMGDEGGMAYAPVQTRLADYSGVVVDPSEQQVTMAACSPVETPYDGITVDAPLPATVAVDYKGWTVAELRSACKARMLRATARCRKADLVERLAAADREERADAAVA